MVGQQFWSKFQRNLFLKQQILYFLLLGITFLLFTAAWAGNANPLINFFNEDVETNSSFFHQYALLSAANKADEQNFIHEGTEPFSEQGSSRRIIAALEGYNVSIHGFSFENYGDEKDYVQLSSAEVERLFGERVCASRVDDECLLTPLAQQWMEQKNKSMGRGHCDGMATLSLLFYLNQIKVEEFGSSSVNSLQLDGNQKLQREIAYWWATQSTEPTRSARDRNALTPSEVVKQLVQAFKAGRNSEVYTIALWKPHRRGGHAVTPFAVEERGNNIFAILVYDNNYPNTIREILVDSNADTWRYNSSVNPDMPEQEYQGDAKTKTLLLTPTSFRLQLQKCPFCEENIVTVASKEEAGVKDNY